MDAAELEVSELDELRTVVDAMASAIEDLQQALLKVSARVARTERRLVHGESTKDIEAAFQAAYDQDAKEAEASLRHGRPRSRTDPVRSE